MKMFLNAAAITLAATSVFADPGAYLEITVAISDANRGAAADVYFAYKEPFLNTIEGAEQKSLLVRDEDIQVLHGFDTVENATAYLESELFNADIVTKLGPLFETDPEIRIYQAN